MFLMEMFTITYYIEAPKKIDFPHKIACFFVIQTTYFVTKT